MPNTASARKRLRQNVARRARNRAAKSALRTQVRKVRAALKARDVTASQSEFQKAARMLDKARQRDGTLRLTRGTATQLPLRENALDLVFCVHALHHFDDPPVFICEAHRVIGIGGALAIIGMDPQMGQDRWYLYDYFPGTYEADLGRYPAGDMILPWMAEAGFVRCERRVVAHISHGFIGRQVLDDPILQKNGTSQLSLLTESAFENGMTRIWRALQQAEQRGEEITFPTHIAYKPLLMKCSDNMDGWIYWSTTPANSSPRQISLTARRLTGTRHLLSMSKAHTS